MDIVLYFLAFPGLPLFFAARWYLAMNRYVTFLGQAVGYREPTFDDVVERGIFGAYRKQARLSAMADAAVRTGLHGEEGQRLLRTLSRRQRVLVASLVIALVLVMVLATLIPAISTSTGQPISAIAVLIMLLGAIAVVGATQLRVSKRFGEPGVPSAKRQSGSQAFIPPTALDRSLSTDEDAALRWVLWVEDFPGAIELRAQVAHVSNVWATWGRTTQLDLVVTDAVPAPVSDGALPVQALVVGADDEPEGFITVWVKSGYLSSLEYSWFTERMPTEYPSLDRLRLFEGLDNRVD